MTDVDLEFTAPTLPLSVNRKGHWAAARKRLKPWQDAAWAVARNALVRGHWLGGGKWLSRRLAAADPGLHQRLTAGAAAAISHATDGPYDFADAVKEVLDMAGGPLWAGYSRNGRR